MAVYEGPATAFDLADAIDSSLQNAQYRLGRLLDAGIVDVVGTWYSTKGSEMKVYGPAAAPLVICAGPTESEAGVRQVLANRDGPEVGEAQPRRRHHSSWVPTPRRAPHGRSTSVPRLPNTTVKPGPVPGRVWQTAPPTR